MEFDLCQCDCLTVCLVDHCCEHVSYSEIVVMVLGAKD